MPAPINPPIATRRTVLTGTAAMLAWSALSAAPARAASDAENLVDKARITLDDVKKDKEFGNARDLLRQAKAVMIVPELLKGGFFIGGEGGSGVLLGRQGRGWSYPAFYTMASASFGLQIGGEESELVLIVLSDKAKRAFMSDEFKVGAQAGIAVVTLGSEAEADTTSHGHADIVVWASSSGAYAGITLNGSVIKPRSSYNESFYGRQTTADEIVNKNAVANPRADRLRNTLMEMS